MKRHRCCCCKPKSDDSLVATCRWLKQKYERDIRAYWEGAGFDMKIFWQCGANKQWSVTFTGYEFVRDKDFQQRLCSQPSHETL